ncbi:MAG: DUF2849 domain-containing protein [Paracoccaceae bacterium]
MAKTFSPAILTANDLLDGDAVWWTGEAWSRAIGAALIAGTAEAAAALTAEAASPAHANAVVGPYLIDIEPGAAPRPRVRREAIRAEREPTFAYGEAAALRAAA